MPHIDMTHQLVQDRVDRYRHEAERNRFAAATRDAGEQPQRGASLGRRVAAVLGLTGRPATA